MAFSLLQFAEKLTEVIVIIPAAEAHAMEQAAVILEVEAKGLVGVPKAEWPPLAQVTIDRKGTNTPLLESGELQASYQHNSDRHDAYIGSDNPKAKWHEFGTMKAGDAWGGPNPARPVLALAVIRKEKEVLEAVGREIVLALEAL